MDRKNITDIYKLSPIQQGMLFHSLYTPSHGLYIEQFSWTDHHALDSKAFAQAWQSIVDHHPILRTAFFWETVAEPLQVVHQQVTLPMNLLDWSDLGLEEQEAQLEAFFEADQARGFVLSAAPLMRVTLIRRSQDCYQCIWSYHHLLLDGWSVPLVLNDVFNAYTAIQQGQPVKLSHSRPFRDYIAWLRQQDPARAEAFWREQLKGFATPTPLGMEQISNNVADQADAFSVKQYVVPGPLWEALQTYARQAHLTTNTLLQGAWALLLGRYSDQGDVVFGTTLSGRSADLPGSEMMVGVFINTLPVRVRLDVHGSLADMLSDLQTQLITIGQYEYSSLLEVQSWSDVPRGRPLFESIVVFENYPQDFEFSSGLQVFQRTNYPLMLVVVPRSSLTLRLTYDRQRFTPTMIERVLGQLQTILEQITTAPRQRLADVALLTAAERQQIVTTWNATQRVYDQQATLHDLVTAQALRTPTAVAVVFEDCSMTYAELDSRANQLANYLHTLGVGPETRVAICLERSLDLIIGLLGSLKAGAAYVPLDPTYPPERLQFMLADSQACVLITQQRLASTLGVGLTPVAHQQAALHIVSLDTDWSTIAMQPVSAPPRTAAPDNLAYVIYTSGSTGQPKGAMNTHRGIRNRLLWMQETYQLAADDRVLQKTPSSFDVSVWEFFWPLITGAVLVMARPGGHQDPAYLVELIAAQRITTLHFVPSMLRIFLDEPDLKRCTSLKRVICSGEALPYDLQERCFAQLDAELHNLYGPTEAAVDVSFWACQPQSDGRSVPIGRPVANTQLYVLDRRLNPVPVGTPGELYIGGVQVGRGYLDRPTLTAERFVPDPFSHGMRLYKTGDLARFREDGAIEFLGRLDYQVKIRGNRVELGEIEDALAAHPGVQDVVVIARDDALLAGPGSASQPDSQLVAYLVLRDNAAPSNGELRAFLQTRLPSYMLPTTFVTLAALPLTPSGKLDRKALPAPERQRADQRPAYSGPRTELERTIATVWAAVLRVEQVGLEDNFFDLGGHSLSLMQMHAKLRQHLDQKVSVLDLFKYTTVSALATFLSRSEPDQSAIEQVEQRTEQMEEGKNRRKQRLEKRQQR